VGAFALGGCNFFNRNQAPEVSQLDAEQAESGATDAELPPLPDEQNFSEPLVQGTPISPTVVPLDLIRSTNPNERALGVQRSRPDPFANLTVGVPLAPIKPPEQATAAAPAAVQGGGTAPAGAASTTKPPASSGTTAVRPSPIQPLPAIPQPSLAEAIQVSGVIQIDGKSYAIVQPPNEVARYVQAGDRISGGQVLVKRIDARMMEPRVVLEQNGIEVSLPITASATNETSSTASAAGVNATPAAAPALPVLLPLPGI
jgi:hypothetical protein